MNIESCAKKTRILHDSNLNIQNKKKISHKRDSSDCHENEVKSVDKQDEMINTHKAIKKRLSKYNCVLFWYGNYNVVCLKSKFVVEFKLHVSFFFFFVLNDQHRKISE